MFKILAKLQKIFYSAKKLRHKMSFLLKNHSLVAKSAAKVMPKARERILTLVNSLKTLASEYDYLLCRKISLK